MTDKIFIEENKFFKIDCRKNKKQTSIYTTREFEKS